MCSVLSERCTEGAKVRTSLRSRAAALRTKQITDAEADAAAATERMSLPIVALMAGFLIFIGFPAVAAVLFVITSTYLTFFRQ